MISTDQLPQQFRPLDAAEEAALRVSIKRFGVIYPVAVDTQGNILDGHHRYRLSKELDMKYPVLVIVQEGEPLPSDYLSRVNAAHPAAIHAGTRRVLSMDPEAIAQTLNMDRRHLTPDQRKELAVDLRREGRSERAIADALKVSQTTVHRDLEAATDSGESVQPVKVTGLDGKVRRAPVKKADTEGPRQMDAVYTRSKLPAGRTTTAKSPSALLRSLQRLERQLGEVVDTLPDSVGLKGSSQEPKFDKVIGLIQDHLATIECHLVEETGQSTASKFG